MYKKIERQNHAKLIIVDNQYAIIGSTNFLNNKWFNNSDISLKIYDENTIKSFKEYIMNS